MGKLTLSSVCWLHWKAYYYKEETRSEQYWLFCRQE